MTTAHRSLTTLGRSRLLMAAVLTAMVASLAVGLPGSAGAVDHLTIGFVSATHPVEEGDDGTVTIELEVEIEEGVFPEENVEFTWTTSTGGADPATVGEDYVEASGTGTIRGVSSGDPQMSTTITIEDGDGNLINGDTQIEDDETFLVELTGVTSPSSVTGEENATVGSEDTVTGTIENDDPKISIADTDLPEGEAAQLAISLTEPVPADGDAVTVQWNTADGTDGTDGAVEPDDYTAESDETATIGPGEQTTVISVQTVGDSEPESDETFTVTLSDPVNAFASGQMSATVTILDDDPRVSIDDVAVFEGHTETTTDAVFTVTIDPPPAEEVSVNYETADDTAQDGSSTSEDDDYQSASGAVTFDPGEATRPIVVKVNGDVEGDEGDEHFEVQLTGVSPDSGAHLPDDTSGTGTIIADDGERVVTIADGSASEGDDGQTGPLTFTVTLDEPYGNEIVLDYTTSDGPEADSDTPAATDGLNSDGDPDEDEDTDYQAAGMRPPTQEEIDGGCSADNEQPAHSVTIPAGDTEATVDIDLVGDGTHESDEAFTVELAEPCEGGNPPLSFAGDPIATGTIVNDDARPTIIVDDVAVDENDSFSHFAEFDVRLSHPSSSCIDVDFATADGTATVADGDYEKASGVLVFLPGTLTPEESDSGSGDPCPDMDQRDPPIVEVFGDEDVEATETFDFELFNATGAKFPDDAAKFAATGTIINDDGPAVSVDDVTVEEGDSGTRGAVFQVSADTTDHDGFTVDVATADDTATAGSDYTALETTTLHFDAGETTATVTVPVHGDTDHEEDETFLLKLSNANFAVVADGEGVATIVNDDEAPAGDGGGDDGGSGGDNGGDDGGTGGDGSDLGEISRSAGATRIETALQVSRDHWDQAPDVVLANAATFPDALAGGTLSALLDAPLLLTFPDQLSDGVAAELERLGTQTVWILGGPAAVSVNIQQQLVDAGFEVHRFFGEDRFATAAEIARGTGPSQSGEVVLTLGAHVDPGRAWPDALSAGALSAVPDPLPVLLTRTDSLPQATVSALSDLEATTVYVLGGPVAISEDVESQLVELGYEVTRLAGATRYATSVAAATEALRRHGDSGAADVVLATGQNFPDGLAAGALAARLNGLLLLVPADQLADETAEFLNAHARRLDRGVIVGGEQAIGANVADHAAEALVADG